VAVSRLVKGGPAGLYGAKAWFSRRLRAVVDLAVRRNVSPDVFTVAGVFCAAVAGAVIALGWWPFAAAGLVGRLAGANLDGAVARARGVARPFGFVVNEVGDRASDLLIMGGLVALAWRVATPQVAVLMVLAALAATLPTFAALAAAGAGAPRVNGGPFGKTERCMVALAGCVLGDVLPRPGAALAVLAGVVVVGSLLTAGLRLAASRRVLGG
jgi:CDP-diacylglycerol--glycerol-3-phosphate 3-phosphatidyltransferase